ncbi:hypothetical protein ACFU6S_24245 [Streptomyces sp. NPDC057456]|uniref:hypothetical protein n=1 Tax=Streptomyces sp. NPDC057456 TaxID=3346139 RepID=UPI003689F00D
MSLIDDDGDVLCAAEEWASWSIPGMEESLEEPQAARARAAAVPAAATARRRTEKRVEAGICEVFPGRRTAQWRAKV